MKPRPIFLTLYIGMHNKILIDKRSTDALTNNNNTRVNLWWTFTNYTTSYLKLLSKECLEYGGCYKCIMQANLYKVDCLKNCCIVNAILFHTGKKKIC